MTQQEINKQHTEYLVSKCEDYFNKWADAQVFILNMPWYIQILYGRKIRKFIAQQYKD